MAADDRVDALRRAVEASSDDHTLRLMLAEALQERNDPEALDHFGLLLSRSSLPHDLLASAGAFAVEHGRLDIAKGCLARVAAAGDEAGTAELEQAIRAANAPVPSDGPVDPDGGSTKVFADGDPRDRSPALRADVESTRFADVGGMTDVKKIIHRLVILPLTRGDLLRAYGRRSGGGVLLYGPPGCGKTMIARATAGECGMPFVNVRIEDVVDPYLGVSESNLHAAFETARALTPSVLFLDELDALAYARARQSGETSRRLVNVLLSELDASGSDNSGVLVLSATNAPWDVDDAAQRPGRFDRTIFVPPPDREARAAIVTGLAAGVSAADVDATRVAEATALFSGADLRHMFETAADRLIDVALETGATPPIRTEDLLAGVAEVRPTTLDWLNRAEAYVEFANASERYSDIQQYLKQPEVKRRRRR